MTAPIVVPGSAESVLEVTPGERDRPPGRLALVLAGSMLAMVSGWNAGDLGPVADPLAATYGVSLPAVGLLITSLLLVHSLTQIPAGDWTDRLGARRAGLVALAIVAAGNVVTAVIPSFGIAIIDRAAMGLGTALAFLAGSSFLRMAGESALAQGWLGGMGMGGSGLAIALVPRLETLLSWRAPYLTALALCVPALLLLAAAPSTRPIRRTGGGGLRSVLAIGNTRLLRLALLHTGSMGVAVVAAAWVVALLTRHGDSVEQASAAGSLTLLLGMISRPAGGWLQLRRPAWLAGLVLTGIVAVGLGMVLLVGPWGLGPSTLGSALVGLGSGLPFGLIFNEAARARPGAPATAIGFVNTFANGFVVIGTPLVGLAFVIPGGAPLAFLALAGIGALSGLALPGLNRRETGALRSR